MPVSIAELARLQFALTIGFHFFFSSLSIGLALLLLVFETRRWRTGREIYDRTAVFLTKIFALTFTVGAATGIAMEFQFGTNWSTYSRFVGDIFGAPLAAEGVLAFFLESGFLGVLVFGRERVGSTFRWFSALMVAFGSTLSGLWILIANSWMQTPAGYVIEGDRARLTDFWAAAFNPSTIPRFLHTIAAAWTVGAFVVVGIAAWYLLHKKHLEVAKVLLPAALVVSFVGSGLMFVTGDVSARQVAQTQQAKFAGMQGLYRTSTGVPLVIWSLPPTQNPEDAPQGPEILVARLMSFLAFGNFEAPITGLDAFPTQDWPPIALTFLAFHNMVLLGSFMALLMLSGVFLLWRRRLFEHRNWLWFGVIGVPLPMLAIQLGWMTAEVGRQPWIVYNVMRTDAGVSPIVPPEQIVISIGLLVGMYRPDRRALALPDASGARTRPGRAAAGRRRQRRPRSRGRGPEGGVTWRTTSSSSRPGSS